MNAKTLKAQALPALLAGTSRQPMNFSAGLEVLQRADAAGATLDALSLTAQALRFQRPLPPPSFNAEAEIQDHRPILPDALRRTLIRLLNDKKTTDDLDLALAWAFARCKVRPHPFDLPKIDAFVRVHAEHLGQTAQHWTEQREDSAVEPQNYFDADELDAATWSRAPLGQRARFIAEGRKRDAAAARALVESVWAQENADGRVRLLMALEAGLSNGDQAFLEGLAKDRAPRVRSLAQRYLARICGGAGEHPALQACLERIRRSTTGLLKKRTALTLELPATVKEHEAKSWIRSAFADVSCDELARALDLSEAAMMESAAKNENLLLAFTLMATQDRRLDLLDSIVGGGLNDAWEQLSVCAVPELGLMATEERLRWAEILVRPYGGKPPTSYAAWSWLHRALQGAGPAVLFEPVFRSSRWLTDLLDDKKLSSEWLELLASLCPAEQRGQLRALMTPLDPTLTITALPLLEILDSLEKVGHHE